MSCDDYPNRSIAAEPEKIKKNSRKRPKSSMRSGRHFRARNSSLGIYLEPYQIVANLFMTFL